MVSEGEGRLAVVLCIDRSGSMGYGDPVTKMEQAKGVAASLVGQLGEGDLVGAVAFDSEGTVISPLTPAREGDGMLSAIRGLVDRGATSIARGLSAARGLLSEGPRWAWGHILLLTDGRANLSLDLASGVEGSPLLEEELIGLCRGMRRARISVSSVAIGEDAFADPLRRMGEVSGGAFCFLEDIGDYGALCGGLKGRRLREALSEPSCKGRWRLEVHGVPAELPAGRPTWSKESTDRHVAVVSDAIARAYIGARRAVVVNPRTGKGARVGLMSIEEPVLGAYRRRRPRSTRRLRAGEYILMDGSYRLELGLRVGDEVRLELY